jgi:hypothetical protein
MLREPAGKDACGTGRSAGIFARGFWWHPCHQFRVFYGRRKSKE